MMNLTIREHREKMQTHPNLGVFSRRDWVFSSDRKQMSGHLFVTGKDPVLTGKHAQMTGLFRQLTGTFHLQSHWVLNLRTTEECRSTGTTAQRDWTSVCAGKRTRS